MQVIGKDWTRWPSFPRRCFPAVSGGAGASAPAWLARRPAGAPAVAVRISGSAMLGALLLAAHPVHGAWGSGKLLHTAWSPC